MNYSKQFIAGWGTMDLKARKLVEPPPALLAAFRKVPHGSTFVELPSLSKD